MTVTAVAVVNFHRPEKLLCCSTAIVFKEKISTPGLKGMAYLEALALCEVLEEQDAHFVDYVLKPATDEMWNLMTKEEQTIEQIIENCMLQFNLRIAPEYWLPVLAGWQKAGLITAKTAP